jgi:hypothetical protein
VALAGVALAVMLAARSLAVPAGGTRRQWHPLPAIAGLMMIASLIGFSLFPGDLALRVPSNPFALAGTAGLALVAFAVADFLFLRVLPLVQATLTKVGMPSGATLHGALALTLIPVVAATTVLAARLSFARVPVDVAEEIALVEQFDLPGDATGVEMVDGATGYLTLAQGAILRFELPDAGGELRHTTLAEDREFPRGITIAQGRLYVVELGSLPCKPAFPICVGRSVAPRPADGERMILETARGRISSFAIESDGGLSDEQILLGDLPVADSQHGVNGLATGPDGDVYVSIGYPDALRNEPIGEETTPHPEWLGTVVRVDPRSGEADVYARGFRNVYGLAFDDRGGLWGVDNDGPARNDWRGEELLQIKQGRDYGYPMDGTFGPWSQRDDGPVWLINHFGSAGILWAADASMPPGVFVGSCGGLSHLPLYDIDGRWSVQSSELGSVQLADLLEVPGCITDIAAVGPRTILASVFGYGGGGSLLRITFAGDAG